MIAAARGHVDLVQALLDRGANIHARDNIGRSALSAAAMEGFVVVVSILISRGGIVNQTNIFGNTPLQAACHRGQEEVARKLLAAGASVTLEDSYGRTALDYTPTRYAALRALLQSAHSALPATGVESGKRSLPSSSSGARAAPKYPHNPTASPPTSAPARGPSAAASARAAALLARRRRCRLPREANLALMTWFFQVSLSL
jgi:hypothetical protein